MTLTTAGVAILILRLEFCSRISYRNRQVTSFLCNFRVIHDHSERNSEHLLTVGGLAKARANLRLRIWCDLVDSVGISISTM